MNVFVGDAIEVATTYVGGSNTVKIWVDWNNDGVFGEDELEGDNYVSSATTPNQMSFAVPEVANGDYRMRIRGRWGTSDFGPCEGITWGSAVDFTLSVGEPPASLPCIAPEGLTTNNITSNSAEISWNEVLTGAGVMQYEYALTTDDTEPVSGTFV